MIEGGKMPLRDSNKKNYTGIMIRVLILEEHAMVRQALAERLCAAEGLDVIHSTGEYTEAVQWARGQQPEVVLMEIKTSEGMNALEALRKAFPNSAIIVLTSYLDSREEAQVLKMGARAYLLKSLDTADLVRHIQETAQTMLAP
jgi:DNA-binding NarL/FixJ family response regulator